MMKAIGGVLVLIFGLVFGGVFFYQTGLQHEIKGSIQIEVASGEGFYAALHKLIKNDSQISFKIAKLHLKLQGLEKSLKPGEYFFESGTSVEQMIRDLSIGNVVKYKVVIPEGYNSFEIADLLITKEIISNKKSFLKFVQSKEKAKELLGYDVRGLEGYLYPATYEFSKKEKTSVIVKTLVDAYKNNFNSLMSETSLPKGFSQHDLVTLASVVEKETGAAQERPRIAAVFLNRLKKRMRLQSDPTTIYGQWVKTGERLFNIRKKHLLEKNEFNTYAIRALPAGPISNPGIEALRAVCKPERSDYLYFVSKNDGTHYFSKTYKEHSSAVRRFQMSRKARAGKSWRDLNKGS